MRTFSHMSLRGFNEKLNSSSIHPVHRNNGLKASFVAIIQIAGDYRQEWKENMDMRMDNCFEGLARSSSSLIPFPSFTSTQRMRQRVSKHRRPLSPQPWTVKWLFEQFHSCLLWTSPCTLSRKGLFIHPEGGNRLLPFRLRVALQKCSRKAICVGAEKQTRSIVPRRSV